MLSDMIACVLVALSMIAWWSLNSLCCIPNNAHEIAVGMRHALGGLETWSNGPCFKIASTCLLSLALAPLTSVLYPLPTGLNIWYVCTNPLRRIEKEVRWHAFEYSCKIRIFSRSHFWPQMRATSCRRGGYTWDLGSLKVPGWPVSLALHPREMCWSFLFICMALIAVRLSSFVTAFGAHQK